VETAQADNAFEGFELGKRDVHDDRMAFVRGTNLTEEE